MGLLDYDIQLAKQAIKKVPGLLNDYLSNFNTNLRENTGLNAIDRKIAMRGLDGMAGGDLQQAKAENSKQLTQKMVDLGLNFNPAAVGMFIGKGAKTWDAVKAAEAEKRLLDESPRSMQMSNGLLDSTPQMKKELDYQIEHKPMTVDGGASQLHDLTTSFGEDVYGKNAMQYFGSGDAREKEILKIMSNVRGNPDSMVTIYRGVPDGVDKINPGDWVTLHPGYAEDYGNVIKMQVPAKHITSWPDSLAEFGYFPD